MTKPGQTVRRSAAAAVAITVALTTLTLSEAAPAAAASCSPAKPSVTSVVAAATGPRVRSVLSSHRDSARSRVTSLSSRRSGSGAWSARAVATSTVAVTGRARVTTVATSRVTLTAHVVCSGVARAVSVRRTGTGTATSTAQARVTTTATGTGVVTATTSTRSRTGATRLATSRSLTKATSAATGSSRALARRRAAVPSLSVARLRSVVAARKAALVALNASLATLGIGPVTAPPSAPRLGASPVARVPAYPANGTFDYQIGGAYTPAPGVTIVDRDRTASPVAGRYNVCYINAFQSQPGESSAWGSLLLRTSSGSLVQDPGWPGEYVVDTRRAAGVAAFVGAWIRGCAAKGFQAVELDNLDSDTRSGGLLTSANNLDVFRRLVAVGHAAGVAVAQKNTVDLSAQAKAAGADFAVAEECQVYSECGGYAAVYGTSWVEIEYTDAAYSSACAARGATTSVIRRDVQVTPAGSSGYVYSSC